MSNLNTDRPLEELTENERIQYSHLLRFTQHYPAFPEGEVHYTDNPDLVVDRDHGLLGIEHTRIFRPPDAKNFVMQEQESLAQRIVDRAKELYSTSSGAPPLYAAVLFDSKVRLVKEDIDAIAASLCLAILSNLPIVGQPLSLEGWRLVSHGPSRSIQLVHIYRSSGECEMFWGVARGGAVPHLSSGDIVKAIQKKEAKYDQYRNRCSEVWLLLVEDGFAPSCYFVIDEEVKKELYTSSFDSIFLFRNFTCEVIKLNAKKTSQLQELKS